MNRHVREDTCEIKGIVPKTVDVFAGDMVILNDAAGNIGAVAGELAGAQAAADYKVYPVHCATTKQAAATTFMNSFIGVAMVGSEYGSTDTIAVATAGIFKFAVQDGYTKSAVTLGAVCSAVSPVVGGGADSTSSSTYNYTVEFGAGVTGSGASVGYCVEDYTSGTSYVKVRIRTKLGPTGRPASGAW